MPLVDAKRGRLCGPSQAAGKDRNEAITSRPARIGIIERVSEWFHSYGFSDVYDELLIGAYPLDSSDVSVLERLGVRRVLNLAAEEEYQAGQRSEVTAALEQAGIEERRLSLEDYGRLPPEALESAVQQVTAWLDAGQRSYVHCRAGWQRSAAVAAGVVALRDGIDVDSALDRIRVRKPSANPLPHQREDLERWWQDRV
jgi:protein-tyrosine phosphatase